MSISRNRDEFTGAIEHVQPSSADDTSRQGPARTARVMVCVRPDRYAAAELIAGASLSQELGARCDVVSAQPANRASMAFRSSDDGVARLNTDLAKMLGIIVVDAVDEEPGQAAIDFANKEEVTHAVFGEHVDGRAGLSSGSLLQRFSTAARGVEVRVVPAASQPQVSAWNMWASKDTAPPAVLLFAVLFIATAAIVYVPWPITFALTVIAAAVWCWHLDQRGEAQAAAGG